MSIDTVRISTKTKITSQKCFVKDMATVVLETGEVKHKLISSSTDENGNTLPRLTYHREDERLVVEVSLPKFDRNENCTVLTDDEISNTLSKLIEWTAEATQSQLPNAEGWQVSRLDSCWTWKVESPQAYFAVLAQLPVFGYQRMSYAGANNQVPGFTWRAKSIRVNAYDKGIEAEVGIDGLLRLEIQAINRSACKTIASRNKCEKTARDLVKGEVGRRELSSWLKRINMPEKVSADGAMLESLTKEFDPDDAAPRYFFVAMWKQRGFDTKKYFPQRTYERRIAEARKRGWLVESPEGELQGLTIPKNDTQAFRLSSSEKF